MVRDKPAYCYDSGCPLASKGRGFALGCGASTSPISILFERPSDDELAYTFGGPCPSKIPPAAWAEMVKWQEEEVQRRHAAFPELEARFTHRGAPVRGMSGAELRQWVLPTVGGGRLEDYFLENVLHCSAPKNAGDDSYPIGEERAAAEACCAHWNRVARPKTFDVAITSLHPASMLKSQGGGIVALPLQIDTFAKARAFAKEGKRVLILAGGKAAKFILGYGEAVTKWAGHYQKETEGTWLKRNERIQTGLRLAAWIQTNEGSSVKPRKKKSIASTTNEPTISGVHSRRRKKRIAPPIPGMEVLGM